MKFTRKRLLFVDDEPGIRTTLAAILRRYGFTVTLAANVEEALEQIRTKQFDLLLCDLNLQREADGYSVISAMRESNPRCVTIVLTGYPAVESAVTGIHLGIDDYILKPTTPDGLVALLAEKLAAREPKARILSISYNAVLLRMRHLIFEKEGYDVVSASALENCLEDLKQGDFDIFVLGHSIPHVDKRQMVDAFHQASSGTVVSLRSSAGEQPVDGADYHIEPDPEPLLKLITEITRRRNAARQSAHSV